MNERVAESWIERRVEIAEIEWKHRTGDVQLLKIVVCLEARVKARDSQQVLNHFGIVGYQTSSRIFSLKDSQRTWEKVVFLFWQNMTCEGMMSSRFFRIQHVQQIVM